MLEVAWLKAPTRGLWVCVQVVEAGGRGRLVDPRRASACWVLRDGSLEAGVRTRIPCRT